MGNVCQKMCMKKAMDCSALKSDEGVCVYVFVCVHACVLSTNVCAMINKCTLILVPFLQRHINEVMLCKEKTGHTVWWHL